MGSGHCSWYVTRLRAGGFGVRIPAGVRDFSLLQIVQTGSGPHPASCSVSTGVHSPGIKRRGRDVDQSRPSSAEVKNE